MLQFCRSSFILVYKLNRSIILFSLFVIVVGFALTSSFNFIDKSPIVISKISSIVPLSLSNWSFPDNHFDMDKVFIRYNGISSQSRVLVPTWIVTPNTESFLHRFFDSSPFSPSGRYLGLTKFPQEGSSIKPWSISTISIVDLHTGLVSGVATSRCYDTQVGAHVQWGTTDEELYFNDVEENSIYPFGVVLDIFTLKRRRLDCPVYSISADGRYSASPNMTFMTFTQLGYSFRLPKGMVHENVGAPSDQGLWLTDLKTGKCNMITSLSSIAHKLNMPTNHPLYGFHTKWSPSGNRIMFVVREKTVRNDIRGVVGQMSRHNHVITMNMNGSDIRQVVSWSNEGPPMPGGNHPSWYASKDVVSMNFQFNQDIRQEQKLGHALSNKHPHWSIVGIDETRKETKLAQRGSGHPTVMPNEEYIISDAYMKESSMFDGLENKNMVPIRLIQVSSGKEIWLMQVPSTPINDLAAKLSPEIRKQVSLVRGKGEWRCDAHPTFDKSFNWMAVNARAQGGLRQVLVSYIGNDLDVFFSFSRNSKQ